MTCAAPAFTNAPTRVAVTWRSQGRGPATVEARGPSYRVRRAAAGRHLLCNAEGSNDGGRSSAVSRLVRIPR
jgi:hypothetical protein